MGGCCSSSRKPPLHGRPVYYYCPPVSEEHESLMSHDSVNTALTARFLIDLHVDTSDPDTFHPPPRPIPFDVVLGRPQSPDTESKAGLISVDKATSEIPPESYCKSLRNFLTSSEEIEPELKKLDLPKVQNAEEEDVCPTCLEEYDTTNPKIPTKCCHHFHLSCILEWMERSDTCPICDQEMIYKDF